MARPALALPRQLRTEEPSRHGRGGAAGRRRAGSLAGGALMLAGALATRWSVYKAGFQSAADPKYVVGPQKARRSRA